MTETPSPRTRRLALAGAVLALIVAIVWTVVVPDKADTTSGLQSAAIRLAHPLTWVLLAGFCATFAMGAAKSVRDFLAWAALGSYAAFLLAVML